MSPAKKKPSSHASGLIKQIKKRDGTLAPFEFERIVQAIEKAMLAAEEGSLSEAELVAHKVLADLVRITKKYKDFVPSVEGVQDTVEKELILSEYVQTAKAYILYREKRNEMRNKVGAVPEHVKKLAAESKKAFRNPLSEFIYYRTYSRWIENEGRRETWVETVNRYVDFMKENLGKKLSDEEYEKVRDYITHFKVMPSMRLMWSAGSAARKTNVCAYNCSFIAPTKLKDFGEIMYLSMCGTGVGFSVESQFVEQLPQIQKQTGKKRPTVVFDDSKEGWAEGFVKGLEAWFAGDDVDFDYSKVRPAGARLITMGGKSSGPAPLMSLIDFAKRKILGRQGRRLSTVDVHDIVCKIGEIVVSGGVRRSALISLSDLDDQLIRDAKKGQFYMTEPQRSMANNSAVYLNKPSTVEFMDEWVALMKSGSGERGIFNRGGLEKQLPARRLEASRGFIDAMGTNPCGEIVLRSKQFCNLTEIVARAEDKEEDLIEKAKMAAIIGTYQSTLTNFGYLSSDWKKNCEAERLLGVSVTGMWDSPAARKPEVLKKLRDVAIKTNKIYAKKFGVNESTAVTCIKPSGTVSQLVDSASGMHPRHAKFYIRRVRISATDSLFQMLKDQGVPFHPEVGQTMEGANTFVLEFPVKAPDKSIFKDDMSAIEQLEFWKNVKTNFTEHNPSVTVSVGDDEWIDVAHWLYNNWDLIGGLSFLPRDNHVYKLAPYEEIDEKTYNELLKRLEHIDFSKIVSYEADDQTKGAKELACVSGVCEI